MLLSSVVSGAALKIGDLVTGRSSECVGMGVGVSVPTEETDDPQKVCLYCASLYTYVRMYVHHTYTHTHTRARTCTHTHTHTPCTYLLSHML